MPLVSNDPTPWELPDLKLVGACTFANFFENNQHTLFPETWARLHQSKLDGEQLANPTRSFGLELYPPGFPKDHRWYYCACVEVKSFEITYPSNLLFRFIPAAKYLKFTVEGPVTEIGPSFRYIYQEWLPKAGVKLAGFYDLEMYDERFKNPSDPSSQVDILLPLA
jgi:AraC family transcriptional regulator